MDTLGTGDRVSVNDNLRELKKLLAFRAEPMIESALPGEILRAYLGATHALEGLRARRGHSGHERLVEVVLSLVHSPHHREDLPVRGRVPRRAHANPPCVGPGGESQRPALGGEAAAEKRGVDITREPRVLGSPHEAPVPECGHALRAKLVAVLARAAV